MHECTAIETVGAGTALSAGPQHPTEQDELDRLGDEIAVLAAHLHAAMYRLLVCLRAFDVREGWRGGWRNCAQWLSWRTGIAPGAAREKVRVARALAELPLLSEAMRSGELSYAKVRALTRVATPANEARLLEVARHGTAAHVEEVVRAWRRVDRLAERAADRERHARRHLTLYVDEDGTYVLRARLEPEVGAVLQRALEAATFSLDPTPHDPDARRRAAAVDYADTPSQRRADALGLVAESALAGGRLSERRESERDGAAGSPAETVDPRESEQANRRTIGRADRFQVVVHVDANALRHGSKHGQSVLADGVRVSAETSRRLACDASRLVMVHGTGGQLLDVGRRRRTVPPAIRRALDHRDRGCRFPGCGLRFCDAHHIVHWADGGATRLDNLLLLCRFHHRLLHEEGYRVERGDDGGLRFYWPNGRPVPEVPTIPGLSDEPVRGLERTHREQGIRIDAWTATPDWRGEALDVDWAVLVLRGEALARR